MEDNIGNLITFVCFDCGKIERFCPLNKKRFKLEVNKLVNIDNSCKCGGYRCYFKNQHGESVNVKSK